MTRPENRLTVNLEGAIWARDRTAHHNRELALALREQGIALGILATDVEPPAAAAGDGDGDERLAGLDGCGPYAAPDVTMRHRWPPDLGPAGGDFTPPFVVQLLRWEHGSVPRAWLAPLRRHAHELWVESPDLRAALVGVGFSESRVALVGAGVNPAVYRPEAAGCELPTGKRFRFLFVGAPDASRGFDLLLAAYRAEFGADEDVTLIVKEEGAPGNARPASWLEVSTDAGGPEVVVIDDRTGPPAPGLYTACQAVVLPYRVDALAQPVLEAMACGVPVAAVAHASSRDLVHADTAFPIAARRTSLGRTAVDGYETVEPPTWLEAEIDELRRVMRRLVEDRGETERRAAAARALVTSRHTWKQVAQAAGARLAVLEEERHQRLEAVASFVEGTVALSDDRPWDACASLERALAIEPCFPFALSEYGVALARTGRLDGARRVLERAVELDPELEEAAGSLAVVRELLAGGETDTLDQAA